MTIGGRSRPGRLIAASAAFVLVLGLLLIGARLVRHQAPPLLATNGVGVGAVITALPEAGDELCLAETPVPAGTGALQLWLGWAQPQPVPVRGELRVSRGEPIPIRAELIAASAGYATLELARPVVREQQAELCITRGRGEGQLDVAGASVIRQVDERSAELNGEPLGGVEPSLRLLDADQRWRSSITLIDEVVERLGNLTPSPLGRAGVIVAAFVVFPAGLLLLVWNLVTAPSRSRRRVAAFCVLGSLAITTSWATITPTFQGPDEPEHFAYAQYLAETGRRAEPSSFAPNPRPPYSTQQEAVMALLRSNANVIDAGARQPWTEATDRALRDTDRLPADNGGGFTESASGHSALYYAMVAPAMHLAGDSIETQLWAARLVTAGLAALIAGLAAWAAGILVPGRHRLAALAGLAAATVPMAGAVGGVVNNDALLNLSTAAAFTAVLSLLVRPGGAWRRYAAAGALVVLIPLAKAAGLGVTAALAGALAIAVLLVRPARQIPRAAAAVAGGVAGLLGVLALVAVVLIDGQTLTLFNVHPPAPVDPAVPAAPGLTLTDRLLYIAQTLVPPLHLGGTDLFPGLIPYEDVYLRGLWGGFGWGRLSPPLALFSVLRIAVLLAVVAGLVALWRERGRLSDRRLAVLGVALTPLVAISFVAFAYASVVPRTVFGEQGRYLLVALVPIALWFAAVPGALPSGRARALATGALGGGLCALAAVGLVAAAGGWAA